jgi:hypothetical protein
VYTVPKEKNIDSAEVDYGQMLEDIDLLVGNLGHQAHNLGNRRRPDILVDNPVARKASIVDMHLQEVVNTLVGREEEKPRLSESQVRRWELEFRSVKGSDDSMGALQVVRMQLGVEER